MKLKLWNNDDVNVTEWVLNIIKPLFKTSKQKEKLEKVLDRLDESNTRLQVDLTDHLDDILAKVDTKVLMAALLVVEDINPNSLVDLLSNQNVEDLVKILKEIPSECYTDKLIQELISPELMLKILNEDPQESLNDVLNNVGDEQVEKWLHEWKQYNVTGYAK